MGYLSNPTQQKVSEKSPNSTTFYGTFPKQSILELKDGFLDYAQFEKCFSTQTIQKYNDCLKNFTKYVGDIPIKDLKIDHFIELRKQMSNRNLSNARIASIVFALKSFLRYCKEIQEIECLDPSKIKSPKRLKREVIYLTNEEINRFIKSIKIYNKWTGNKQKRRINIGNLRFRVLVEVLLATGMRISEALSLNIADINFETKEATIIGKGNKQRVVYFSDRSLGWIRKYISQRDDNHEALFITHRKVTRLKRTDIWRFFDRYCQKSGLNKKVTAHTLRHTFATNMLYNGCDLITIKELLGHHDITITARAYIGIDKRKIKENHNKYLNYGN